MRSDAIPQRKNEPGRGKGSRRLLFFLLVLCAGVAAVLILRGLRNPPQPARAEASPAQVVVRRVTIDDVPVTITASGVVSPKVELDIVPEVAGRVVFVHSELKTGGLIRAYEQILGIDPLDYELAVRQARAAVDETQARLDIVTAEGPAQRRLNLETETDSPLASREPQVRQARAALEAAKAGLAAAELRLRRTAVSLPFDVLIVGEWVDLGHYMGAEQPVAKAYGVDAFEIEVGLYDRELAWIPGLKGTVVSSWDSSGSPRTAVDVKATFAGNEYTWGGYIVRAAGRVDGGAGKVPIIVEVPRPLDLVGDRPPLLPGMSVQVLIAGGRLSNAVAVPRHAVRDGNTVWLAYDGRLHTQELDVVYADEKFAYVTSGIAGGAEVVVGPSDGLVEGMQVRTRLDDGAKWQGQAQVETDTPYDKERQ